MPQHWNAVCSMDEVDKTQVFSGGACNILDVRGQLLRNTERDVINDWLTQQGLYFFDPQIHPDTHDREYDFAVDHQLEMAARAVAQVNLYEVSPRTFGGITSLEIAADVFRWQEPMVIYFSDGIPDSDKIPQHSDKGHPVFVPDGLGESDTAALAHYHEFVKNGNNMRKYLMGFAQELDTLTVSFSDQTSPDDTVITPERIHAADIFRAVVKAASGQRIFVTFTGGPQARDAHGNPVFIAPNDPQEIELLALLDEYRDEANDLRRSIAELVHVNVFTRVVYTQRSAVNALEEVLRLHGVL